MHVLQLAVYGAVRIRNLAGRFGMFCVALAKLSGFGRGGKRLFFRLSKIRD